MLEVQVSVRLGDFALEAAFRGPARGVTVLFGASGAGKTAVLSCIAGALRPAAGRIALGGQALFDSSLGVNLPMERRRIGWVFQDARLFPHLTVEENLLYGARRAPVGGVRCEEVVEVLGIGALLRRRPRDLSGGERQRVGLGRALLSQPRLLLMDEPLASLDSPRKAEILPFLERLKAAFDLPILYVTHSLAEAVRLGDRMVVLEHGRVLADGRLAEIVARPDLPLVSRRSEAGAVLEAEVVGTDGSLTLMRAGAWELRAPRVAVAAGRTARIFILARDVMLARDFPSRISARNILAATVAQLTDLPDGSVLVTVEEAGQVITACLTAEAVAALDLQPGTGVWAILKSVAIEGAGGGLMELEL